MKKVFWAYAWILLTVGVMLTSIAAYQSWLRPKFQPVTNADNQHQAVVATDQNSDFGTGAQVKGVESIIATDDARVELVASFLERYDSPLTPYNYFGQIFVDLADKYKFDFRLLPAIAMQESNLCKSIPPGSYNCLGFGIHERGTLSFDSFESNFARAAKELKMYYIDEGLTTPQDIMTKYTPHSNGSWADSVNQWMTEMRYNDRQKGRELDQNSSVLEFASPQVEN